jgi:hypothetical protein
MLDSLRHVLVAERDSLIVRERRAVPVLLEAALEDFIY